MDFLLVAAVAMLASGLTMFSGFGLGVLLLPVFAIFFPVELAVAATAVVHGANNVLKALLLRGAVGTSRGASFSIFDQGWHFPGGVCGDQCRNRALC